ncbi:MAG TPA: MFS transporter [Vicinamibacterales bacterium]|nr:MFS transporter [Vicinamibacterales bacterium]
MDTAFEILATLSFCHLLNDMMQSLIPSIYPILKQNFQLDFTQVGLITFVLQLTGALLQPVVGHYSDRHPKPYALAAGMGFTLLGMLLLSKAGSFTMVLAATSLVGLGSSIFHPESSRMARAASGGRHGFAQSFFQVGGNFGSALGPLLAAFIVLRNGQSSIAWFSIAALVAMMFLVRVGSWYKGSGAMHAARRAASARHDAVSSRQVVTAVLILLALLFSKFVYLASLGSYYTFYLISRFGLTVQSAQIHLFVFLGAVAAGTIVGGPVGDRIGRRQVILASILGVLPFTLALPYANLFWTRILTVIIGLVLASAFSVIVVYAQELMPGRVGMIAGLFFGVAFGISGIGAAALGALADRTDIYYVYRLCSYLPAIGVLAFWLPRVEPAAAHHDQVSPVVPELEPAAE